MKDVGLGRRMFFKGKLKFLPSITGTREIRRIYRRVKKKEQGE